MIKLGLRNFHYFRVSNHMVNNLSRPFSLLFIGVLTLGLTLSSCSKKRESPFPRQPKPTGNTGGGGTGGGGTGGGMNTNSQRYRDITTRNWRLVDFSETYSNPNLTPLTFNDVDPCIKDDVHTFATDLVYTRDYDAIKCIGQSADEYKGTWTLKETETKLDVDGDVWDIESLTSSRLIRSKQSTNSAGILTITREVYQSL